MPSSPLISVISSTYNCAGSVQEAIDSIQKQTFPNVEHLIADGGSTDGTVEIIRRNAEKPGSRINWWKSEPDNGITNAWNKALEHVQGEWVYFLGGDDQLYDNQVLAKVSSTLERASAGARIVYGRVELSDGRIVNEPWDLQQLEFRERGMMLCHQGVFHHRELFAVHGKFDEAFPIKASHEMLARELMTHDPEFVDCVIAVFSLDGLSSKPTSKPRIIKERWAIYRRHGISRSRILRAYRWASLSGEYVIWCCLPWWLSSRLADTYRQLRGKAKYWTVCPK